MSLLLAFLITGTGFVSLCHAHEGHTAEIHFIADSCGSHDCSRTQQAHGCEEEPCQHQICSDESVLEEYLPNGPLQIEVVIAPPLLIIDNLLSDIQTTPFPALIIPPLISPQRSPVLRI